MSFLSPLSLAWLGLLVPLIALYVLKRRRQVREVGSTLLWEAALRDMRAERPWKRLVPHLSLLLQILAIVAGAIALARPVGAGRMPAGAHVAAVIDTSVSMAAAHGDGTRLDEAKRLARNLARGLPPGGKLMVIEAGREAVVAAPSSDDATALSRAIDGLVPRGGSSSLEAAVALATERLRGAPAGSRVVVITDAAADGAIALDRRTVPVEVQRVGEPADNTAIVAADVRPHPEDGAPDRSEVFVRLARFGESDEEVYVTATIDGRGTIASRRVSVPAGETTSVVMQADLPPDRGGRAPVVQVSIAPTGGDDARDALALDDLAVVPSPGARKLPVFLVGNAPLPLERVLRADPDVELFATTLDAIAERDADEPPLDGLFVYAGRTPDEAPAGDSVVVAPVGDRVFEVALGEAVEAPRIVTWDEDDVRLRFVELGDVHIRAARTLEGAVAHPLVTADAGPIVGTIRRPDGETTVVAFDPSQTDWPRSPSFVVFFRNLLENARRRRAEGGVAPGTLGEPLRIPAPDGDRVVVTTPSGRELDATSRGGVAIVEVPAEPGAYAIRTERRELRALRNLLDPSESDLRPRARFTRADAATEVERAEAADHSETWPWLAAALLFILAIEAVWATRRAAT